jgi:glyoxylase-like metal-dependent hydrolase (beta-lactamase superfamily II)
VIADIGMPVRTSPGGVRVERVITSGTFELDGGSWEVDNNVWLLGDDRDVVVIDPAHDGRAVVGAIARERRVQAVWCTHAHNDHVNGVGEVCDATRAPSHLHPQDRMLWDAIYPVTPDRELADGTVFPVGDVTVHVIHTPGHTPGSCCFHVPALEVVFVGDTLFRGGPGATGRVFSDFATIVESIRTRLLTLAPETVVLTGHGEPTTIGDEAPHLDEWIARGH